MILALHTISCLPIDPGTPFLQRYPGMKLGRREDVRHYAELLVPLAEQVLAEHPECTEWLVMGPPLYAIPSAANLLAEQVHRGLRERVPGAISIRREDLYYRAPDPQNTFDHRGPQEYANSELGQRIRNRRALHEGPAAPKMDPQVFRGRGILFVNDINVTGTQREFMQRSFDAVEPAGVYWIYIVQVEPGLGRAHPELESSINQLNLATFDEIAAVVLEGEIDLTARCVRRILAATPAELEPFFRALPNARRELLLRLATEEGGYTAPEHQAKLALLRRCIS